MAEKKKVKKSLAETTVIFLDWDDTCQASSVLCTNGITLQSPYVPREIEIQFAPLQDQVIKFLDMVTDFTKNVFVITNAEQGWVELSTQKFMPRVFKNLNKVQIISARTVYQDRFINQPNIWKKTAMIDRINGVFPPTNSHIGVADINIISFGDSECERNAVLSLSKVCSNSAKIKSIKFVERPSVEQLKRQLEMVMNNFQFIIKHEESLDLMLQISTQQAQPSVHCDDGCSPETMGNSSHSSNEEKEMVKEPV